MYDQLKLLGRFVRMAGYSGLVICLDELVNLYKLANVQARNSNYEQILRILNDSLQGSAEGLGFVLGGTLNSCSIRDAVCTATQRYSRDWPRTPLQQMGLWTTADR